MSQVFTIEASRGLFTYSPEMAEENQEYIRINRYEVTGLDSDLSRTLATCIAI
jgi:hypothetical protein